MSQTTTTFVVPRGPFPVALISFFAPRCRSCAQFLVPSFLCLVSCPRLRSRVVWDTGGPESRARCPDVSQATRQVRRTRPRSPSVCCCCVSDPSSQLPATSLRSLLPLASMVSLPVRPLVASVRRRHPTRAHKQARRILHHCRSTWPVEPVEICTDAPRPLLNVSLRYRCARLLAHRCGRILEGRPCRPHPSIHAARPLNLHHNLWPRRFRTIDQAGQGFAIQHTHFVARDRYDACFL